MLWYILQVQKHFLAYFFVKKIRLLKTCLRKNFLKKNNKDKIIEHLDIIYKDILSIFKKNQIDEISALGEKLDPNKHQAMLEIEDAEKEQGTIVQEIQKGFTLKGRLLRPSLVGVSKKPQKNEEKQQKKEKN